MAVLKTNEQPSDLRVDDDGLPGPGRVQRLVRMVSNRLSVLISDSGVAFGLAHTTLHASSGFGWFRDDIIVSGYFEVGG